MPPLACVSVPELPLQLVVRSHPEWAELPVVVLTEDRPTGIVLHVNRKAASAGVRRGMRYSSALALSHVLRASVVTPPEIDAGVRVLGRLLQRFSPRVEPFLFDDGIFWLDAGGLGYLFPSTREWMEEIRRELEGSGFRLRLSAGFTRGGTLVASRSSGGPIVFEGAAEERSFCLRAPLRALPLPPQARRRLAGLGIRDVKGFLSLPRGGVRMRLGPETEKLHELLGASSSLPLQPLEEREELVVRRRFDREIESWVELEPPLEEALEAVVQDAGRRGARIRELVVTLDLSSGSRREERIRPAEPSVSFRLLRDLLRLRLQLVFQGPEARRRIGITGFAVAATRSRGRDGQIELISRSSSRDRTAAERAFALIRAELGNDAVRRARLRPEHQPERQYEWEILEKMEKPGELPSSRDRVLVRRIFESPRPLPPPVSSPVPVPGPPRRAAGYRSCGGPYTLSGAWWSTPYRREYRFVETSDGALFWIFREGENERWMVQGLVS